jgi:outer membrane protein
VCLSKGKTREKDVKKLGLLIALMVMVGNAYAMKIGVVNVPVLLETSPQAMDASKRMESKFQKQRDQLNATRIELQKEGAELEKSKVLMKDADYKRKQADIAKRGQDWQRKMKELQDLMNLKSNEELKNMQIVVNQAIKSVGEQEKFDLILYEGIAFSSEQTNITSKVLQEMKRIFDSNNKKLNKK